MKLGSISGAPQCWAVAAVLKMAEQPFEETFLSVSKKEHEDPALLSRTRCESVRALYLETEGLMLNGIQPSLRFVCLKLDDNKHGLFPPDRPGNLLHNEVMEMLLSFHVRLADLAHWFFFGWGSDQPATNMLWQWNQLRDHLRDFETILRKNQAHESGRLGLSLHGRSAADVWLATELAFLQRCGGKFASFPLVSALFEQIMDLPEVKATSPPHWKESEGKPVFGEFPDE